MDPLLLANFSETETPTIKIARDAKTGIDICEEWWTGGRLHRANGPAVIMRDAKTGEVIREESGNNCDPGNPPREQVRVRALQPIV